MMHAMRYFEYIAEQAFRTDELGRRVFYRGGPWTRPYLIPDADTEKALLRRQTWLMRWILGPIIFGQPIVFGIFPKLIFTTPTFIGYMICVMIVFAVAGWWTHRDALSKLQRLERRLTLREFYHSTARSHSTPALVLGLLASLSFVVAGYWLLGRPPRSGFEIMPAIGWICMIFFGLCALAWSYALALRFASR